MATRSGRSKLPGIVERAHRLGQTAHAVQVQALHGRGLALVVFRQQQAAIAVAARRRRDRQDAARRLNRAVERQRADQQEIVDVPSHEQARRREHAERNRQIEARALFAHVGRRQVDGDAMGRKLEPRVADRAANPIAALTDAGVGQSHHGEAGQAERHVDLDLDRERLDPVDRRGPHAGEHASATANLPWLAGSALIAGWQFLARSSGSGERCRSS